MNPFEMVAVIVVVGVIGGVLKHALTPRHPSATDDPSHHGDNDRSKQQQNVQAQRVN
jgi:hypothetical protein